MQSQCQTLLSDSKTSLSLLSIWYFTNSNQGSTISCTKTMGKHSAYNIWHQRFWWNPIWLLIVLNSCLFSFAADNVDACDIFLYWTLISFSTSREARQVVLDHVHFHSWQIMWMHVRYTYISLISFSTTREVRQAWFSCNFKVCLNNLVLGSWSVYLLPNAYLLSCKMLDMSTYKSN